MRKQMEGDNRQRRQRARDARERGHTPSAEEVTTGASKQREHVGHAADHAEKLTSPGKGKQQPGRAASRPRPGSR